jgi:uncharacterized protein
MAGRRRRFWAAMAVCLAAAWAFAFSLVPASPAAAAGGDASADKPFAEHHLVLQLSDDDAKKQALVISVAYNLLKFYGPDKIAIEVVAFGPGIALLRADSPNRKLVDSLVAQGVRFDICMNTVETVERETGQRVPINPNAKRVEAGVAQILALTEKGYTLVRP